MNGGNEIDICRALILQNEKNFGKLPDGNFFSPVFVCDFTVLAEYTAQVASRKKDCYNSTKAVFRMTPLPRRRKYAASRMLMWNVSQKKRNI